ncbi:YcxB family protein [Maribacter sp.]|nr:YcxB family protein [Maribacter sp.]
MKITTRLDFKSYSKLMTRLFYKKHAVWGMTAFGTIIMVLGILGGLAPKPLSFEQVSMFLVYGFIVVLFPVIVIKIRTKRNFYSNQMLQEEITYEFIDDRIKMTGASFKTEMTWSKVHKVQEVKDWFLIYQSKQLMNLIPKQALGDKLEEFGALIKSQKGLTYKLLKKNV